MRVTPFRFYPGERGVDKEFYEIYLASNAPQTVDAAEQFVCTNFCANYKHGETDPPPIDVFGWSRGAMTVVALAHRLNSSGCTCQTGWRQCRNRWGQCVWQPICRRWVPVAIRFMGLIDAVNTASLLPALTTIPSNVRKARHFQRSGSKDALSFDRFGRPKTPDHPDHPFRRNSFTADETRVNWHQDATLDVTHGDIGNYKHEVGRYVYDKLGKESDIEWNKEADKLPPPRTPPQFPGR